MAAVSRLPNGGKLAPREDYLVPAAFFLLKIPAWSRNQITDFAGGDGTGQDRSEPALAQPLSSPGCR